MSRSRSGVPATIARYSFSVVRRSNWAANSSVPVVLGHDDHAAGVAVQAVDDARPRRPADGAQLVAVMGQRRGQGALPVAPCGWTTMPGGLLTTISQSSSYRTSSGMSSGLGACRGTSGATIADAFAEPQPIRGFRVFAVHGHTAGADRTAQLDAAVAGEPFGQESVQPLTDAGDIDEQFDRRVRQFVSSPWTPTTGLFGGRVASAVSARGRLRWLRFGGRAAFRLSGRLLWRFCGFPGAGFGSAAAGGGFASGCRRGLATDSAPAWAQAQALGLGLGLHSSGFASASGAGLSSGVGAGLRASATGLRFLRRRLPDWPRPWAVPLSVPSNVAGGERQIGPLAAGRPGQEAYTAPCRRPASPAGGLGTCFSNQANQRSVSRPAIWSCRRWANCPHQLGSADATFV